MSAGTLATIAPLFADLRISREKDRLLYDMQDMSRDVAALLYTCFAGHAYHGGTEIFSSSQVLRMWIDSRTKHAGGCHSIGDFVVILYRSNELRWQAMRDAKYITYGQCLQNCLVLYRVLVEQGLLPDPL